MRASKIWRQLLAVERTVIEQVELDENDEAVIVVHVRPWAAVAGRCGVCGDLAPGYDPMPFSLEMTDDLVVTALVI